MTIDLVAVLLTLFLSGNTITYQHTDDVWVQTDTFVELDACLTVSYDWPWGSPIETGREYVNLEPWEIRADIVGIFLWTQFDVRTEDATIDEGVSSVLLPPGSDKVKICR